VALLDNSYNPITHKPTKDHIRKVIVPRLLMWWDWAEQEDPKLIAAGLGWYTAARTFVYRTSRDHVLSYRRVAGAVAIMSQQTRWTTQVRYTHRWIDDVIRGEDPTKTSATLYANVARKAAEFLTTGNESLISGDKISNFYENLCGRVDNVTVDSWAIRAALTRPVNEPRKVYDSITESTVRKYFRAGSMERRSLEAAYKSAASKKAVTASDFQAVVWVAVRHFHKQSPT
jgi:hypothetical protein